MMGTNPEEKDLRKRPGKMRIVLVIVLYLISLLIVFGIAFLLGMFVGADAAMWWK